MKWGTEIWYRSAPRKRAVRRIKAKERTGNVAGRFGRRICERMRRKMARTVNPAHADVGNGARLAKMIPARKASENHIKGSRETSSSMRLKIEGFAACIVPFMIA